VPPQKQAAIPGQPESERLRQEVEILKKRIQQLEGLSGEEKMNESELCIVCYENKINTVLLECGHRAVCLGCAEKLFECPMCREKLTRVIRFAFPPLFPLPLFSSLFSSFDRVSEWGFLFKRIYDAHWLELNDWAPNPKRSALLPTETSKQQQQDIRRC